MKRQLSYLLKHFLLTTGIAMLVNSASAQGPNYARSTQDISSGIFLNSPTYLKTQLLYAPGDLTGASPIQSGQITKIYFSSVAAAQSGTYTEFYVRLGHTTNTTFTGTSNLAFYNTMDTFFYRSSIVLNGAAVANDWFEITLDRPFNFDNTKTLIVEVQMASQTNGISTWSSGAGTGSPAAPNHRKIYSTAVTAATGTAHAGYWQDFGITLTSNSYNNAAITQIALPNVICSTSEPVKVRLANKGNNVLNNVTIDWSVDGVLQPSFSWSSPLDSANNTNNNPTDTLLTLGSVTFTPMSSRTIKAWTSMPNGVPDTSTYNDTMLVSIGGGLSGTYSIGGSSPSFTTIGAAVTALNTFGICGPVIFNIDPASSPYTEQITLNQIMGSSATNTILFNGNGSTIQFAPTTTDRHVIRLNGADYVTFDNLRVVGTDATYGYGIQLMNAANYNTISNCVVNLSAVTSTTSANSAGIVSSASPTTIVTAGNNANYLTITNDTIIGGTSGISLNGTSAADPNTRNVITHNVIQDFYLNGIDILNLDTTVIAQNDIHRMNRTGVGVFSGISLRAGNRRTLVSKNKIHGTHTSATTLTGTAYGIELASCDAPVDSENVIVNNIIYDFNSGSGTIYGLSNTGSDGAKYYHNTIVLDHAGSTAGTTRGFYQTTAASNIHFKNNIISITRGGTGAKNCLYFNTITSSIISNNNVLYLNAPAGTNGIGYWGSNMPTLVDWKAANSAAFDQQSRANNPLFVSTVAPLDYTPTEIGINDLGADVGVTTDFIGTLRTSTPDPGAYEFTPTVSLDAALSWIAPVDLVAAGNNDITVNITNNLTTTINTVEIAYTDGINTVTETFSSLTILAGTSQQVTFTTQYNFTAPVVLRAYIKNVNGGPDGTQGNDTTGFRNICIAFPTGTYTINSALPTGSGNYQTFTSAIAALSSCGILGPIVFNVDPASGPYRERISIPEIKGASDVNTITINGNNRRLYDSSLTSTRAIITLNGADYITIDSLEIASISPTFGWGVHLTNGADNNQITNCTIDMSVVTSTTESASACIVGSGSATSVTTAGNASHNLINRNTLIGAYKGIILKGASGALLAVKNTITNNTIRDFYQNGMEFTETDSLLVHRNDISRANRAAVTTMAGIELGVGNQNSVIDANKIHDTHNSATTQTGAAYGIFSTANDAPVGAHNTVSNNIIYNFNSTSGTQYGLYNSSSNGVHYYYNTISLTHPNSTAGTTHGFYQTTLATDIVFKNNLINISRSGTGAKNCIYLNIGTSVVVSNNNLLNMASTTGTVGVGYFDVANYPTLADWKTANGGIYDAQSISADPMFNSATNFRLLNGSPAAAAGTPIPSVPKDYSTITRSTTAPTIGAYEIVGDFSGPVIGIFQLTNTSSTTNRTIGNNISITDPNGIDTMAHKARIYYKKTSDLNVYVGNTSADNGWKWTTATTNTPPYNFVVDYSILNGGTVSVTDTIQYFIAAQDLSPAQNVGTGNTILNAVADSVELSGIHFPVNGTINTYRIVTQISGTYQVGASSTPFHNLTEVAAALRSNEVVANLTFELMSDYDGTTETYPIVFDQISLASSAHTLHFYPHSSVATPVITEGYPASGTPLLTIDGGHNMTFDGRSGATGDSTNIKWVIRNKQSAATFAPTILLVNSATNNTFRYLDIQSGNTLTSSGTFMFGTSNVAAGNSYNTIRNNYIRNRTDSIGIPANAIYSLGTVSAPNTNNTIDSNRISNFTTSGISISANGNGNTWNIRDNHLYYNATSATSTAQTIINFAAGSDNNTISGNYIGGSTLHAGGTPWNHSGNTAFSSITAIFGDGTLSTISHNTIKNFERTNTGAGAFSGIILTDGYANIDHNMIGDTLTANSILLTGTGTCIGISNVNNLANTIVNIENNWVSNITSTNAGTGATVKGISYTSADPGPVCNIRNNKVFNLKTNSAVTGYAAGNIAATGIYAFTSTSYPAAPYEIAGNTIYGIKGTNTTAATNIAGATITNFWGTFHHNTIYDITNHSPVGTPVPATANGIFARFVQTDSRIHNNMISLTSSLADSVQMNGIMVAGGTISSYGGAQVYVYNTVQISNNSGNPLLSYAFHRGENSTTTQSHQPIVLKNNLFINNVTSPGKHYAVGNEGPLPDSNWIKAQNDYNNFYSVNPANIGLWGTTACDLATWRTLSSSEANSASKAVSFTDPLIGNLHLTGSSIGDLDLKATPIVDITTDFDNETRDLVAPYMGADENLAFPLPVTLVQFTATESNKNVILNWATATENNSSHFEIERSVDGRVFEKLTKVKAKGKSGGMVNYRIWDDRAFDIAASNTLYYRLKMVDLDGKFEYSKTAIVSISEPKESTPLTVFPNPYTDKTYININATRAGDAKISVVDITGKVVIAYTEFVADGISVLSLQQSETLKTGIYFMSIELNGEKQIAKLIKQ